MKLVLIFPFIIISLCPISRAVSKPHTFEFGSNMGHVAFTTSGSIGVLQKLTRVSVPLPECEDLKYVRVDVNNWFGSPSVHFDWETRSVVIEYSPLQVSISQYTVSAKAMRLPYCKADIQSILTQPVQVVGLVN